MKRLRACENGILRRVFGPKMDENDERRKLHNENYERIFVNSALPSGSIRHSVSYLIKCSIFLISYLTMVPSGKQHNFLLTSELSCDMYSINIINIREVEAIIKGHFCLQNQLTVQADPVTRYMSL